MRGFILVVVLASGALAGALDGTRWKMRFWSPSSWLRVSKADKLAFDDDRLTSYGAMTYGFSPSSYTASAEGGGLTWRSVSFNEDGEALAWEGRRDSRRPDRMEGRMLWRQADGRVRQYRWKAKRRR